MQIQQWLGWMLRACRNLGTEQRFRNRSDFARAWPDGELVEAVHVSTIQRWETGVLPVPRPALRRYEELLGLPTGQLTAVSDHLHELNHHRRHPPVGGGGDLRLLPIHSRRVGTLLDRACSSGIVSGVEWDELTGLLTQWPSTLLPWRMWEAMSQRLLLEMLAADGIAWVQRYEAMVRLLTHPCGGPAAIAACASAAGLRNHQAMTSTVAALGSSDHTDSITAMITQVHNPTNDRALTGAVAGLAEAVGRGRLDLTQRRRVLVALQPLAGSGDDLDARSAQILQRLSPVPRQPAPVAPPDDPQRHVTERLTLRAIAQMECSDAAGYDGFAELVHHMLCYPSGDTQLAASFAIAATPYRGPLAVALQEELISPGTIAGSPEWSTTLLAALRTLGGESELQLAERIVTATGIPAETIRVAAFAIAHLGDKTPALWWKHAIDQRLGMVAAAPDRPADIEILRGLTYSAGITGRRDALEQLRSDPRTPFDSRAAATWWLDVPAHILTSARH
ncbi:hypothetical protein [Kribbella deserti]|uniref:XRE family transcriptional regulator n=1 Tax=Kribbella deserti TaxID=1926257 RepID=A0ABV6QFP5_9ACTN